MMKRRSNTVSLLLLLVLVSPSWIQDGVASRILMPETPSPSPSSVVAESPHHHQEPSIISPISHQAPQMPPSISPSHAQAPSPQMPELHYHHHEPPSVSPSQAPKMLHQYDEPASPSPSPSPSPVQLFNPPSPSPISPPPNHYHHHHHGPQFKPPQPSTPLQCWSHVMEVDDCSNEITMAFHGYSQNLKQRCCQTINRTSKDCLFDLLFPRTGDTFFIMWLEEHCARAAQA